MHKRVAFPLLLVALGALNLMGCKNRNEGSSTSSNEAQPVEPTPTPPADYVFIGCRPSVGECYNSCPDHRSQARTESNYCANYLNGLDGEVECFCFTGGEGLPPDPSGPPPYQPTDG